MRKSWGIHVEKSLKPAEMSRFVHNVVFTNLQPVVKKPVYARVLQVLFSAFYSEFLCIFNLLGSGFSTISTTTITNATNLNELLMEII